MKNFTFLLLLIAATFSTFAQAPYSDCHIVYKDIPHFRYYGRQVQMRTTTASLDTLTCVYDGTFAYDMTKRHFVGYDGDNFGALAFGEVRDTIISLSSAEILALNGTPKTVVPAQGSGTLIVVLSAVIKYTHVSTAYTGGTSIRIGTNTGQYSWICDAFTASVNTIRSFTPPAGTSPPAGYTGLVENSSLKIDTQSAVASGDGTAQVWVKYQIIRF